MLPRFFADSALGMDIPCEEQGLPDRLGMVIPAWFGPQVSEQQIEDLLRHTLAGSARLVYPHRLAVVVDGCPRVEAVCRRLQQEWGDTFGRPFVLLASPENRGKGGAVAQGLDYLCAEDPPAWIVTRDADGDHRVSDMPRLVALGEQIRKEQGTEHVAVIGGRQSLYRPMNWLRGELEYWLDEVATEAYKFALAREGRALNTQYWAAYGHYPDLESGCKLFSTAAARLAARALPAEAEKHPELDLLRWGCEIIPLTETVLAGGILGEMRRLTYEGQPVSGYEGESGVLLYANQLVWLGLRLQLTRAQAAQLLDNALLRRPLWSDARGRQIALDIRQQVLAPLTGPEAPEEVWVSRHC